MSCQECADTPERNTEAAHEDLREEAQSLLRTMLHKNDEEDGRKVSLCAGLVMVHIANVSIRYQPFARSSWAPFPT